MRAHGVEFARAAALTPSFETRAVKISIREARGVPVGAFQSEREEETRDRAKRGSAVRGSDQASVAPKGTPHADPARWTIGKRAPRTRRQPLIFAHGARPVQIPPTRTASCPTRARGLARDPGAQSPGVHTSLAGRSGGAARPHP